ncbi:MAG: Stp1/IreP family PP2C-type Ser/Thr phosphatase [Eubacterium sp.]|nr:Stp1/IreP family PP2C-type Ser/Thr phosphatase [Eubacterium sp.]
MRSYGMTDIGKKRKINQDYLFFSDEKIGCFPNLYIVADGMGGHKAGDKASSYAVTRFVELAKKTSADIPFLSMEKLIQQVNEDIYRMSETQDQYAGMGTTFVAASIVGNVAYVMNIGDSRLYYYNGEEMRQVTMDHSLVEELVRAGELNREESRHHPQKNIITKAIGVAEAMEPDFFMIEMKEGDRILLCSDGLSNMVEDDKLTEILSREEDLEILCEECVQEALFYGGLDNIAVVIAQYEHGR